MSQGRITIVAKQPPNALSAGFRPGATLMIVVHSQTVGSSASLTPRVSEPTVRNLGWNSMPGPTGVLFATPAAPRSRQRGAVGYKTDTRISVGILAPRSKFLERFTGSLLRCMTFTVTPTFVGSVAVRKCARFKWYKSSLVRCASPGVSSPVFTPLFQAFANRYLFHCCQRTFYVVALTQLLGVHFIPARLHLT